MGQSTWGAHHRCLHCSHVRRERAGHSWKCPGSGQVQTVPTSFKVRRSFSQQISVLAAEEPRTEVRDHGGHTRHPVRRKTTSRPRIRLCRGVTLVCRKGGQNYPPL